MKTFYKKMLVIVIILMITNITKLNAQATDGQVGTGNLYGAAKFLGWNATSSGDLLFKTGGNTNMVLQDGTGFFGIGIGLTTPQSLLHLHQTGATAVYTQWTNGTTGNGAANVGLRIGLTTAGVAEIRQEGALDMNFFTDQNLRMTILSTGEVGIGITPTYLLDVNGDIDIADDTKGYHIDGNIVLHYRGKIGSVPSLPICLEE